MDDVDFHAAALARAHAANDVLRRELTALTAERDALLMSRDEVVGRSYGDDAYIVDLERRVHVADAITANNATTAELLTRAKTAELALEAATRELAVMREQAKRGDADFAVFGEEIFGPKMTAETSDLLARAGAEIDRLLQPRKPDGHDPAVRLPLEVGQRWVFAGYGGERLLDGDDIITGILEDRSMPVMTIAARSGSRRIFWTEAEFRAQHHRLRLPDELPAARLPVLPATCGECEHWDCDGGCHRCGDIQCEVLMDEPTQRHARPPTWCPLRQKEG